MHDDKESIISEQAAEIARLTAFLHKQMVYNNYNHLHPAPLNDWEPPPEWYASIYGGQSNAAVSPITARNEGEQ